MMCNFSCRKTRRLLALSAGSDAEGPECPNAQRHLAVCPHCREVWKGLQQAQRVLERVSAEPVAGGLPRAEGWPARSVWPGVARHLQTIDEQAVAPGWRGWLPSGALAAACLAVVMVALPEAPFSVNTANVDSPTVIQPQPVGSVGFRPERRPVWVREVPDVGHEQIPLPLEGGDEPRSF
jgi:hypothetical protein